VAYDSSFEMAELWNERPLQWMALGFVIRTPLETRPWQVATIKFSTLTLSVSLSYSRRDTELFQNAGFSLT